MPAFFKDAKATCRQAQLGVASARGRGTLLLDWSGPEARHPVQRFFAKDLDPLDFGAIRHDPDVDFTEVDTFGEIGARMAQKTESST